MSGVKSVEFGGPKTDFLNRLVETCADSGFDLGVQLDAVDLAARALLAVTRRRGMDDDGHVAYHTEKTD